MIVSRAERPRVSEPCWRRRETIWVDRITVLHADGSSTLRLVGGWGISCLEYFWELPHSVAVERKLFFFFFLQAGEDKVLTAFSFCLVHLALLNKQLSTIPTVGEKRNRMESFYFFHLSAHQCNQLEVTLRKRIHTGCPNKMYAL